jgi:hypothetical protein
MGTDEFRRKKLNAEGAKSAEVEYFFIAVSASPAFQKFDSIEVRRGFLRAADYEFVRRASSAARLSWVFQ